MVKKFVKKSSDLLVWVAGVLAILGIGVLFISGTFANTTALGWAPMIVHSIFGWIAVLAVPLAAWKKFKK